MTWGCVILKATLVLEIFSEVQSHWWRRDIAFVNNEFQSHFSTITVRLFGKCVLACSSLPNCQFITFNNSTRGCKMYSYLEGPLHVQSASLWKGHQQCITTDSGQTLVFFAKFAATYDQAYSTCNITGGHLAVMNTPEKVEKFRLIFQQNSELNSKRLWWVGGQKTSTGWKWLNGQAIDILDVSLWAPNNPSGNGECLRYMIGHAAFDDVWCFKKQYFVCERDENC